MDIVAHGLFGKLKQFSHLSYVLTIDNIQQGLDAPVQPQLATRVGGRQPRDHGLAKLTA